MADRVSVEQHRDDVERLLAGLTDGGPGTTTPGAPATSPSGRGTATDRGPVGDEPAEQAPVGEVPVEDVAVGDALARVLAADVRAPEPLPRFRNSQMDGFAVRAVDIVDATTETPAVLTVTGEVAAGSVATSRLAPGTALRIMTGAPLPDGADTVVPVEDTDLHTFNRGTAAPAGGGAERTRPEPTAGSSSAETLRRGGADDGGDLWGEVRIRVARAAGEFVREAGSDVQAGDLVLSRGTVLAPHHLAAAAACGVGVLPVRRPVRVAIVSTGSELVAPGQPAGPGQIWDANAIALAAAVRAAGAEVAGTFRVTDDPAAARDVLRGAAASSDLVITSGGVSQGAHEVIKDVLSDVVFRPVAMQPGGPQGLGTLDGTPVLTFPGNPVSAQVSFVVFLRDLLRRAAGLPPVARRRAVVGRAGESGEPVASPPGRRQFLRGRLRRGPAGTEPAGPEPVGTEPVGPEPAVVVDVVGGPGSHLVASMAAADVLIDVPAGTTTLRPGDEVTVIPL